MSKTPSLIIHSSSQLPRLAQALAVDLALHRPPTVLATQDVVVAHPGMAQWLRRFLAEWRETPQAPRIVSNLRFRLPGEFFAAQVDVLTGAPTAPHPADQQDTLLWSFFEVLGELGATESLRPFLADDSGALKRWQLARRMAGVFVQYQIYRRDWLTDWADGASSLWQAQLWRLLLRRHPGTTRGARLRQALELLADGPVPAAPPAPIFVFGLSHAAPDQLRLLEGLALHRTLRLYLPNPCQAYWSDIVRPQQLAAGLARGDSEYFEIGHPLLASLGIQGRDFFAALQDFNVPHEVRELDPAATPRPGALLAVVQDEIRALIDVADAGDGRSDASRECAPALVCHDDSLLVHACHTRLRELEVLHDRLLDRLSSDRTLEPQQIVVMAPNIADYAPLIAGVFGAGAFDAQPSRSHGALRWRVADLSDVAADAVLGALRELLDLGQWRFSLRQVLRLLECPSIARRWAITAEDRRRLADSLREAHVSAGLDQEQRESEGAGASAAHSFAFGIDRLGLGYFRGDSLSPHAGVLPLGGAEGTRAAAPAALAAVLARLARARRELASARRIDAWLNWLAELRAAVFAEAEDDDERAAHARFDSACAELREAATAAGFEQAISWEILRADLIERLQRVLPHSPLLGDGVLFCGMVPFRSLPFRVIAVLGLNDREFPRDDPASALNLIEQQPRRGDRRVRDEDRYLFLETLMNAGDAVHLSYIGLDPRDGAAREPAAPLAELLEFLRRRFGPWQQDAGDGRLRQAADGFVPWWIRHPLQPFDRRYYDGNDPRLFSFSRAPAPNGSVAGTSVGPTALDEWPCRRIDLGDLLRFFANPARHFFEQRLALRFAPSALLDREPLAAQLDEPWRLAAQLLDDALQQAQLPLSPPAWLALSGALPAGSMAAAAYAGLLEQVRPTWRELTGGHASVLAEAAQGVSFELELDDSLQLHGVIPRVRPQQRTLLRYRLGAPTALHRLCLLLEWCALGLSSAGQWQALLVPQGKGRMAAGAARFDTSGPLMPWSASSQQMRRLLLDACAIYRQGLRAPLLFFPRASWAYCARPGLDPGAALAHAEAAFGEHADPRYVRWREADDPHFALLRRWHTPFDEGSADALQFAANSERVYELLLRFDEAQR